MRAFQEFSKAYSTPTKSLADNYKMKLFEYDSCRRFNIKRQARCFGARGAPAPVASMAG